jgi:AraC-like DNA-binding protein
LTYREHPAPAALTPWLDCGWERCGVGGAPVRVLPDGCIDIVWTEGRGVRVVGPNTTAFVVALDDGVRVAGVRMRPGGAPPLLGLEAADLLDGALPLERVWGDAGRRLELELSRGGDGAVGLLVAALLDKARASAAPDPLVDAAVGRLRDPRTRVEALADELAVSARQLRRRFETAVGYGPKRLARVLRLERALAHARSGDELAQAAAAAGYADQAHFAHDCRALAGVSPGALLV